MSLTCTRQPPPEHKRGGKAYLCVRWIDYTDYWLNPRPITLPGIWWKLCEFKLCDFNFIADIVFVLLRATVLSVLLFFFGYKLTRTKREAMTRISVLHWNAPPLHSGACALASASGAGFFRFFRRHWLRDEPKNSIIKTKAGQGEKQRRINIQLL